ncbi:MAG: 2-keto-4-pentenoate hydratase [Burkholderiales bacterium]
MKPDFLPHRLTAAQIDEAAHALLHARAVRVRLAGLPAGCAPAVTEDAEAICEAMADGFERPIGGWKVGCTDPGMPAKLGLERPFCGQVPQVLIYTSGASVVHSDLMRAVVEPEIVFQLGQDLPPRVEPYSRAEILSALLALYPSLEIPESRLLDDHPHGAMGMVADQGYAGRIVLGPEIRDWQNCDLSAQSVAVAINGLIVAQGKTARAMGNPIEAVLWLANARRQHDGLRAGQVISTGTLTGVIAVRPGDEVTADYGALGKVLLFVRP